MPLFCQAKNIVFFKALIDLLSLRMSKLFLEEVLKRIRAAKRFSENISAWKTMPLSSGEFVDYPDWVHPSLQNVLKENGIKRLYSHQSQAAELIRNKKNVVIVTPTASGKTLCYNLPVLDSILKNPETRALYLFPTKALSQDQMHEIHALITALGADIKTFTYDGDTPDDARKAIRSQGHVVVTNPDMLHAGILPHHTKWQKLFTNLKVVVLDELHIYRGVFGSHLTNVIRRLKRICRFYNSNPVFVCCSATVANPAEHALNIIEDDITLIDHSGAPLAAKTFVLYNPPVVNRELGIRASALRETERIAELFLENEIPTIIFATSRLNVEVLTRYLKDKFTRSKIGDDKTISSYRGGYLPNLRREIEAGLREGKILGVISTNALELGIDIGDLSCCIMAGYPGTIASTWQQAGRAGRREGHAVAILVGRSNPMDQYIVTHPEYFFEASPEHCLVNPDNLLILVSHIKCAAFELPFEKGEIFGKENLEEILNYLEEKGVLHLSADRWHWSAETYPADEISIRSASPENFVVVDITDQSRVIAEVDYSSAFSTIHEGSIYMVESRQYHVDKLDIERQKAYVKRVDVDYFTDAMTYTNIKVLEEFESKRNRHTIVEHGEVQVIQKVVGYKKIKFYTSENVGYGDVNLPEQEMHTTSYWFTIPKNILFSLPFNSGEIIDGLLGVAYVIHHLAAVLLMADLRDINRCIGDKSATWFVRSSPQGREIFSVDQKPFQSAETARFDAFDPTLFFFDQYPGGIGFSSRLFELHLQLISGARQLIAECRCQDGCPSCVGPINEVGTAAKKIALAILDLINIEP